MVFKAPKFPLKHYEDLFEELMQYTRFQNTDQVKGNLRDFFTDVDRDSESKKRKPVFAFSGDFRRRMGEAIDNIFQKGQIRSTVKAVPRDIKPSKTYSAALADTSRFIFITEEGRRVWKSLIIVKEKQRQVWRDEKGRFATPPK